GNIYIAGLRSNRILEQVVRVPVVQLPIFHKAGERNWRWLEREYRRRPDNISQQKGYVANVGSDVDHDLTRVEMPSQKPQLGVFGIVRIDQARRYDAVWIRSKLEPIRKSEVFRRPECALLELPLDRRDALADPLAPVARIVPDRTGDESNAHYLCGSICFP